MVRATGVYVVPPVVGRGVSFAVGALPGLLAHCESAFVALRALLRAMAHRIETRFALVRERYFRAVARMEA